MITFTEEGFKQMVSLAQELVWLQENHPEKTALIALAEAHLRTLRMAGSCDSASINNLGGHHGKE